MLSKLPRPFFVLAPMDDVADTVFRQIVADCAPPDLFFTEFVNVDGLQSPGRPKLLKKLQNTKKEQPLIAQIWGLKPDNFYKTAQQIADGSLAEELAWHARRSGSDKMQGSKEKRMSRTDGTVNESRTRLTQQFTESGDGAAGSASRLVDAACASGFAGIDLNMGCPVKEVVRNGACSALMNNRELASEIIKATQVGAAGKLPVSVKTRLGFNEVDFGWQEFLLGHELDMLVIHGRTRREMSKVPANWEAISKVRKLRDNLAPKTLIVGNGDVMSREQGLELAKKYKLDGIMIGRGVFNDPFVFASLPTSGSPWSNYTKKQKVELYKKHIKLFAKTWQNGERNIKTLNKFCKIYINGFAGAKEMREQLMHAESAQELLNNLEKLSK